MPPKTKAKRKNNVMPPLSFVESPTSGTIRFHNFFGSQSQPLEVPTVPYTEGGKWLALHFSPIAVSKSGIKSTTRTTKKTVPNDVKGDWKSRSSNTRQKHRNNLKVLEGDARNHGRARAAAPYVPLEVTTSAKEANDKRRPEHDGSRHSAPDHSGHRSSAESSPNKNVVEAEEIDNGPVPFSVQTPVFNRNESRNSDLDCTIVPSSPGVTADSGDDDPDRELALEDCIAEPAEPAPGNCRERLNLFVWSDSDDGGRQTTEELVPNTPEHEYGMSFEGRRLKRLAAHRGRAKRPAKISCEHLKQR